MNHHHLDDDSSRQRFYLLNKGFYLDFSNPNIVCRRESISDKEKASKGDT